MHDLDPKIPVHVAFSTFGGQSSLARVLGMTRAGINDWKNKEFVPPLPAHRLARLCPQKFQQYYPK